LPLSKSGAAQLHFFDLEVRQMHKATTSGIGRGRIGKMETLKGKTQENLSHTLNATDMNDFSRVPNKCRVF